MPKLDKTGPMGQGAQTGKKRGQCGRETDTTLEFEPRRKRKMGQGIGYFRNQNSETSQGCGRGHRKGLKRGKK